MSAIIVVIFMTIVFRINMGTTAALKELEAETLFSEEKVDGPLVKGIVASERTFLAQSSERLVPRKLVESFSNDDDAKKLRSSSAVFWHFIFTLFYMGKTAKISPKIDKIEIW